MKSRLYLYNISSSSAIVIKTAYAVLDSGIHMLLKNILLNAHAFETQRTLENSRNSESKVISAYQANNYGLFPVENENAILIKSSVFL